MVKKSNWTNEEDLKLIKLFKLGYKSKDIAIELNRTKEAVQKRVQMFKKKEILFERDRRLGKIESREIKKAINRENSNFMGNRALIKASMSAYRNNSKGDLVLDTKKAAEQGFVYTEDMPKKCVNEEIRKFEKHNKNYKNITTKGEINKIVEGLGEFRKEIRESIEKIRC